MSNYAAGVLKKTDLANSKSDVEKLDFDKLKNVSSNLSNLKSKIDESDVDKLVPIPVDLSKESDVVKNDVVKKTEYNELVKKVNNIKTTGTTVLVKKTGCNTKINEIENKITTNYDHDKYITTQNFNKLTSDNFAARLPQANLGSKSDIAVSLKKADFTDKLKNLNKNVTPNKTKHILVENESNELSKKVEAISTKGLTKHLINGLKILDGAKYFSSVIFQNYLVFIPAKNYIKYFNVTAPIY